VDTVVLSGINSGLTQILLKYNPTFYNRIAEIDVVTGTRAYDLPVLDTSGNSIRIKDILAYRLTRSDGTDVTLTQVEYTTFITKTSDFELEVSGTPCIFSIWERKLYFDMVPSEDLTLTMFVESYSIPLTTANLSSSLPIEADWDIMVESFATAHVYAKLQQVQMASFWQLKYEQQRGEVPGSARKIQQKDLQVDQQHGSISDPVNNPLISRLKRLGVNIANNPPITFSSCKQTMIRLVLLGSGKQSAQFISTGTE